MALRPLYLKVAPSTAPAPFGLLDTFPAQAMPPQGSMAGIEYDTEFCGVAHPWDASACLMGTEEKVADDGVDQTTGVPIILYHLFTCRLIGDNGDPMARARRSLELGASRALEEGFGDVIGAAATDITPSGTAVGVTDALALLEQYGGANYGGKRVIHANNATVTHLIAQNLVRVVGGHLETILGSTVVSGPGYAASTGPSAPAAGAYWMYVTGSVNVWKQAIKVDEIALDMPYTNQFKALAEQIYVPTYECFAAAVETTLEA